MKKHTVFALSSAIIIGGFVSCDMATDIVNREKNSRLNEPSNKKQGVTL